MAINLLYHDVAPQGNDDASGFRGPQAARYKLTPDEFGRHLKRIAALATSRSCSDWNELSASRSNWSMTFDDGGVSAATSIASALESHGWRGWFFIATDFIGTTGFCSSDQIRELHDHGHVIGSHSCSHPEKISACSHEQLLDEWSRSCQVLQSIIGQPVYSASVPGGFYSTEVASAAASAGIRLLFTSEPSTSEFVVDGCRIAGRYNIYRGMSAAQAGNLLTSSISRGRQTLFWNVKKIAKRFAGPLYKNLRKHVLQRAYANPTTSSHQ